MAQRAMVKLIHADGFFKQEEAEKFKYLIGRLHFTEKDYGYEIENFNQILSGLEPIMSKVLGEKVVIDHKKSGIFRKPKQFVHFENFESLNEWCFVVALDKTTFNMFHHLKSGVGEQGEIDARSALDGWQFNYRNFMEWNVETNIVLEENQGVFFRPWMFHSLDEGKLVQYYRLISDRSVRVLIMGAPGQGKTKLAEAIHKEFNGSLYINSYDERVKAKDIDFNEDGQSRHAYRLLEIARKNISEVTIIDASSPLEHMRNIINPDIIVWVDKKNKVHNKEWDEQFEAPQEYDFRLREIDEQVIEDIIEKIKTKKI